jgi:HEAT repeat protein
MADKCLKRSQVEDSLLIKKGIEGLVVLSGEPGEEALNDAVFAVSGLFYIDLDQYPEMVPVLALSEQRIARFGGRVVDSLLECFEYNDFSVDLRISAIIEKIGGEALPSLLKNYTATNEEPLKLYILYLLGKISDAKVLDGLPIVFEALDGTTPQVRDSASRTLGKICENVSTHELAPPLRLEIFTRLFERLGDLDAGVRSKAYRSLGKMVRFGLLGEEMKESLLAATMRTLGDNDANNWDLAYVVRMEAKVALGNLLEGDDAS